MKNGGVGGPDGGSLWERIEPVLYRVAKASRYMGGEWNSHGPEWEEGKVSFALAYPDVYEIGSSNLGLQILREVIEGSGYAFCERVYMPWLDMIEVMQERRIPLFSLETHHAVSDFDVLGISLAHELTYTNVLEMLALAGIPMKTVDREGYPLVVGGGSCSFNPEPICEYLDMVVLGDGEEPVLDIIELVHRAKADGWDRYRVLENAACIEGVYVPSFYRVDYHPDGRVKSVETTASGIPSTVKKRAVSDLDRWLYPREPVVSFMESVHDRFSVEVFRGCTRGCRFCQAGMITRPVRERKPSSIIDLLEGSFQRTGYDEVSLASLSSSDYSRVRELCRSIRSGLENGHLTISLPSLRTDGFSVSLASEVSGAGRGGLTFAPEAGTGRLRRVINKDISEEGIIETVKRSVEMGWNKVKLYFMIGLPTETEEDVRSIGRLVKSIKGEIKASNLSPPRINVSVSTFVPKPHTPFQWAAQDGLDEVGAKQAILQRELRMKGTRLKWHDRYMSMVEGLFARGDRRMSTLLEEAWRLGCRFDSWSESFSFSLWERAIASTGIEADFYLYRERGEDEVFPWDHLSAGLDKGFLWSEYTKALRGETSPDCRWGECQGCGVCDDLGLEMVVLENEGGE